MQLNHAPKRAVLTVTEICACEHYKRQKPRVLRLTLNDAFTRAVRPVVHVVLHICNISMTGSPVALMETLRYSNCHDDHYRFAGAY